MSESAVPLVPNRQPLLDRLAASLFRLTPWKMFFVWFQAITKLRRLVYHLVSVHDGKHFTQTRNTEECFCMFVFLACAMQCDPTKDKPYIHVPFAGLYCNCSTNVVILFLRNIITKFEIFISMTIQSCEVSMAWCKATFTGDSYISGLSFRFSFEPFH